MDAMGSERLKQECAMRLFVKLFDSFDEGGDGDADEAAATECWEAAKAFVAAENAEPKEKP